MATTATPIKPIKADHEITLTLKDSAALPPNPMPVMAVGQTVLYKSSVPGEVRIEFPDQSPFCTDGRVSTSVTGGAILTLLRDSGDGVFESRCFIKPTGGEEVGWSPGSPLSGIQHKVTPPL